MIKRWLTNYHSITNYAKPLYSGREEPAKQISQKYTLEVSKQQKRWMDKFIKVNFFLNHATAKSHTNLSTFTLKRKPVWERFSVHHQCVPSPVYVKNSKRIDEWKIRGNCIKLFPRYWAIFICVIYLENSLQWNNINCMSTKTTRETKTTQFQVSLAESLYSWVHVLLWPSTVVTWGYSQFNWMVGCVRQ